MDWGRPLWRAAATIVLAAQSFAASSQALPPRLGTIPTPAPANEPFFAVVTMQANQGSLAFYGSQPIVVGDTITAYFDSGCGFVCPSSPPDAAFPLRMPALAPGEYQLSIVDGVFPSVTLATFSFTVGAGKSSILITHPSPPLANQPFDGELRILAHPDDLGIYPPDVRGSDVSFLFDDYYCISTCSNELTYRSFPVHFPALAPGTYDVQFVAGYIAQFVFGPPPLPPVAQFSLTVSATPSTVPITNVPGLLLSAVGLIGLAWRALRWRRSRSDT